MAKVSVDAVVREQLQRARDASAGRSAETIYGGQEHVLRQVVVALTAGTALADHENPGEATAQVLAGRVRITSGDVSWDGGPGDLIVIPPARHHLQALEDAAVLLTVAKRGG
jgi:quercetin dioxygenase-like cupin family protein